VLIEYRRQRTRCARRPTPIRNRHSSVRRYPERWCRPRPANAATRAQAGRRLAPRAVVADAARRRTVDTLPEPLPNISRENILKILGVTITNHLSASEHIRRVISDSAQSLYALRVLRHHGMSEIGLHAVFRAVILSRLMYASPAWSGFITATDRQRVDAFLRRTKRCGFCPPDMPYFDQLLEEADEQLFQRTLSNQHHTLYQLLPPQSAASQNYNLRPRTHDRQLYEHLGHLTDCNFIIRQLYKNAY